MKKHLFVTVIFLIIILCIFGFIYKSNKSLTGDVDILVLNKADYILIENKPLLSFEIDNENEIGEIIQIINSMNYQATVKWENKNESPDMSINLYKKDGKIDHINLYGTGIMFNGIAYEQQVNGNGLYEKLRDCVTKGENI